MDLITINKVIVMSYMLFKIKTVAMKPNGVSVFVEVMKHEKFCVNHGRPLRAD